MNRLVLTSLLCLVLAIAAAGAAAGAESGGTLEKSSVSEYADVEDGELSLDFSGLNDDAVTSVDGVFTVEAAGDGNETVSLDGGEAITFYAGGDRSNAVDDADPVELEPGENETIGASVDTGALDDGDEPGTVTVSIDSEHVDDETTEGEDVRLEDVVVGGSELEAGETLPVVATYENHGDEHGEAVASLVVDGVIVDSEPLEVEPGADERIVFEHAFDGTGKYDVGIDDWSTETATVTHPDAGGVLNVTEAAVEPDAVSAGDDVTVTASATNDGNQTARFAPGLAVGGALVEDAVIELEPGEETTVSFEHTLTEPGTYDVSVAGESAGSVAVEEGGQDVSAHVSELPSETLVLATPPAFLAPLLFWHAYAGRFRQKG